MYAQCQRMTHSSSKRVIILRRKNGHYSKSKTKPRSLLTAGHYSSGVSILHYTGKQEEKFYIKHTFQTRKPLHRILNLEFLQDERMTGQQRMHTSLWHLILPLVYLTVCVSGVSNSTCKLAFDCRFFCSKILIFLTSDCFLYLMWTQ